MKKILFSLFLFLILTSCSQDKKSSALENCADFSFSKISTWMYDVSRIATKKYSDEFINTKKLLSDHGNLSLRLIKIQGEMANTKDPKKLNILRNKENELNSELNPTGFYKKLKENTLKRTRLKLTKLRNEESESVFKSLSFSEKSQIKNYYRKLQRCEKEHDSTPASFILKWQK